MILLMFAGDIAMMSVSTDRVAPSPMPDRWAVGLLSATGLSFAALLLLLNSAVFWTARNVLQLGPADVQTLVFVWLVFAGSQCVLYLTRGRGFVWTKPYPGRWVILATIIDIGLVTLLATQGLLMASIPVSLIGAMLALAVLFLLFADLLKVALGRLIPKFMSDR
jgi:H+-transporting ATPase